MAFSVINDAVHGVMNFESGLAKGLKKIVNQPLFQRLRHIKQLGLVDLIFPTAVHTRFSHSLGCAYMANKMATALDITEESKKLAVTTALIHDIGHGPFSHAFEKLLIKNDGQKVTHEDWTESFLNELSKEADFLKKDKNDIIRFIKGEFDYSTGGEKNIIADIISSQLDADRLDYLLRDSHFCGVSFGQIDADWIINKLVCIKDIENAPRMGIHLKGVNSAEHYLLARRLMTRSIYNHSLAMLYEKLLITLLEKIVEHADYIRKIDNNDYLKNFLYECKKFREDLSLSKDNFIKNAYDDYKNLVDYDIWSLIRKISNSKNTFSSDVTNIAKLLYNREKKYDVIPLELETFSADNYRLKQLREKYRGSPSWHLLTLEGSVTTYRDSEKRLYIERPNDKSTSLSGHTSLISYLDGWKENYRYLAIYEEIDESLRNEIATSLDLHLPKDDKSSQNGSPIWKFWS